MSNNVRRMVPIGAIRKSNKDNSENYNYVYADEPLQYLENTDLVSIVRNGELKFIHIKDLFYPALKVDNGKVYAVQNCEDLKKEFTEFKVSILNYIEVSYKKIKHIKNELSFYQKLIDKRIEHQEEEVKGVKSKIDLLQTKENNYYEQYKEVKDRQVFLEKQINDSYITMNKSINDEINYLKETINKFENKSTIIEFIPSVGGEVDMGKCFYVNNQGKLEISENKIFLQLSISWINHTGKGSLKLENIPKFNSNGFEYMEIYLNDELIKNAKIETNNINNDIWINYLDEKNILRPVDISENGILRLSAHSFI